VDGKSAMAPVSSQNRVPLPANVHHPDTVDRPHVRPATAIRQLEALGCRQISTAVQSRRPSAARLPCQHHIKPLLRNKKEEMWLVVALEIAPSTSSGWKPCAGRPSFPVEQLQRCSA
jgi:hypothetical protein